MLCFVKTPEPFFKLKYGAYNVRHFSRILQPMQIPSPHKNVDNFTPSAPGVISATLRRAPTINGNELELN